MKVKFKGKFMASAEKGIKQARLETPDVKLFGVRRVRCDIYYTREDSTPMKYVVELKNFKNSIANVDEDCNFEFECESFTIKGEQHMIHAVKEEDKTKPYIINDVSFKDIIDKVHEVPLKLAKYGILVDGFVYPIRNSAFDLEVEYADFVLDIDEGSIDIGDKNKYSDFYINNDKGESYLNEENLKKYKKLLEESRKKMDAAE